MDFISILIVFIPFASCLPLERRCLSGPFGRVFCRTEDQRMSFSYSKNTLEDIVINRRKDRICVKERVKPVIQTPPPIIQTPPPFNPVTPPPRIEEQTVPANMFTTRRSRGRDCLPGVSSCNDFYAKNTLEDLVINRRKDKLCVKSENKLEALK